MKKLIALLVCCLFLWPAGIMAQEKQDHVTLTYNGQTYECTYFSLPKCCGEADTRYDISFSPVNGADGIDRVSISFPTVAQTGDRYMLHKGEAIRWISFYSTGANGICNYVSEPESLLGNKLVSDEDFFELTVHELVKERGTVYVDATAKGSFLSGAENFELHFRITLLQG